MLCVVNVQLAYLHFSYSYLYKMQSLQIVREGLDYYKYPVFNKSSVTANCAQGKVIY